MGIKVIVVWGCEIKQMMKNECVYQKNELNIPNTKQSYIIIIIEGWNNVQICGLLSRIR